MYRAVVRGVANELEQLVKFLNDRYADDVFNRVDFNEGRRFAATCSKGCDIDVTGDVAPIEAHEGFISGLAQLAADEAVARVEDGRGVRTQTPPGRWAGVPRLEPQQPHYSGKVVVLVDEVSQSQAEYTTMAFRAAGAIVVGSTTAGADGNVSQIPLPGGLRTMISGLGVFYPDKRPTQRVGIVADVTVRPTIAGIRAGCDEVLEEALRQILGRDTPADRIVRMARPRP